jgi:competence ComEA-like helix-hairpin-helix protein
MHVCEGQRLGALAVLMTTLAVYAYSAVRTNIPLCELQPVPWGNQKPGMIAVEIRGDGGGEGIYFFPGWVKLPEILKGVATEGNIDEENLVEAVSSMDQAITITVDRGVLKLTDMPAVKRLALGLRIDLNDASEEELWLVPGIGKKIAAQIVQLRQTMGRFQSLEDLRQVSGIGKGKLNSLRRHLTLGRLH